MVAWKLNMRDGISFTSFQNRRMLLLSLLAVCFLCAGALPGLAEEQGGDPRQTAKADQSPPKPSDVKQSEPPWERLHPERVRYGFYSLFFTTVPLSLSVLILMFFLHSKGDSKTKFEPFFGEGQVTQLVVIILVAGNVCTLAIMGVLGQSEVAAIYGGIVGYVLGKKTSPATASETQPPAQTDAGANPPKKA